MKKDQSKLSELIIKDFESFKKKATEDYYKVIQSHTKDNIKLADHPKYIAIANKYKPFEV